MVGSLLLFRMLHCRKKCQTANAEENIPTKTSDHQNVQRNRENICMKQEPKPKCRVCLKEGSIPLYGNVFSEDLSKALVQFGGIEIDEDDDQLKYLCESCHKLLKSAILLRKTAQKSDVILKNSSNQVQADDLNDSTYADESAPAFEYNVKVEKHIPYYCKRCGIDFETFKEYCDHRVSEDHENRRITCTVCNKSYTAVYYKKHMAIHQTDCPYMCDICGKKFIAQGQFSRHRLTHFFKLPFKCPHCPYRGRFTESLKMHMRSHTGEKPYQCSACASRFVSKSNLNKHMYTHKEQHDFKCDTCDRGFYTKRNLEMHIKVDHVGVKEHLCNICGKAFGYRKQMMKHQLKVHKRQKLRSGRMPLYLQVEKLGKTDET